ncbi:Predicted ATP-dependent carboligase, ATP-grasp superfamily [Planifilum fulgidum]|uniref:Predicted ATP-dependent carboligase, ATP-grasp superfamily n=1 Tax=Planifilum fulgidum TaxID=201973 RepID=A0A1I2KZJ2_9BACL|nr:ATP-grasp domain-containing protein [Planifilum fulgidum]SFF70597.1 Predicted ATP-dependent carboligase, ATP-grasp superfamily [Planifilum fulgidum]
MSTEPTVLLTGGRAPVALHLARLFREAGFRVLSAESMKYPLLSFSNAVDRCFSLPGPAVDEAGFVEGLASLIREHAVDWLIPTCEETFYVAKYRRELGSFCRVLADDLDTLARLHHKGVFIEELNRAGELVPKTAVVCDLSDWRRAVEEIPFPAVLKPAYSRFATQVHFLEEPAAEPPVSLDRPWVLQERIPGPQFSTYAVAQRGRLTAYSCYRRVFRVGTGSSITFRHEPEPLLYRWTERLVKRYRYTGQIAFDFIRSDEDGKYYPLECNPRATSGIHLFTDASLVEAMTGNPPACAFPDLGVKAMLGIPVLLYGWRQEKPRKWLKTLATHRDVIFDRRDLLPSLGQGISLLYLFMTALRRRIPLLKLTTWDIEWEGEEDGKGTDHRRNGISRTSPGPAPEAVGAGGDRFRPE